MRLRTDKGKHWVDVRFRESKSHPGYMRVTLAESKGDTVTKLLLSDERFCMMIAPFFNRSGSFEATRKEIKSQYIKGATR
jgi:hypothetical protein